MATRLSLEEWRAVYIALTGYRASALQVLNNFLRSCDENPTDDRVETYDLRNT
jgi:hypothetical protein